MSHIPMTLESLAKIDDGAIGLLVKKALLNVARDCVDRPTDPSWRKVLIEIQFRPIADGSNLKHVEFVPEVKCKTPSYRTAPNVAKATMNGLTVSEDYDESEVLDD